LLLSLSIVSLLAVAVARAVALSVCVCVRTITPLSWIMAPTHSPTRAHAAPTQRQPSACGLPFTHTLSHIATPSFGSWLPSFSIFYSLFPLALALLLLLLLPSLLLLSLPLLLSQPPASLASDITTLSTHHIARARKQRKPSLHSLTFALADCALRSQRALCVSLSLRVSVSQLHTQPQPHHARPLRRHSDSLLAHSHTLTHTLDHTLLSKCVWLARAVVAVRSLLSSARAHRSTRASCAHTPSVCGPRRCVCHPLVSLFHTCRSR